MVFSCVKKVFSCEFCEIFKDTFYTEHLRKTAFNFDCITHYLIIAKLEAYRFQIEALKVRSHLEIKRDKER